VTPPLPIQRLHHIARVTTRPDESTAFYRDVLGFREIPRPPFDFRGAWLYAYGVQIHIIENSPKAPDAQRDIDTRDNHLAFQVEDVDAAKRSLEQRGIEYCELVNAGGVRQVFFRDPDGHFIEIAANYAATPAAAETHDGS
jgi:catechol 2,3-dioxygenase-like lactoylglutathione lyase family enzyme